MSQPIQVQEHHVAHHFDTAEQEKSAAHLGMWLFIGQEILFFGGLFVLYTVMRFFYPEAFHLGSHHLSWQKGALNTVFLILSSLAMVQAVWAAQVGQLERIARWLWTTFVFAGGFLVVKSFEYAEKIHHGTLPSRWYSAHAQTPQDHLFFGFYFASTGLHALHVIVGMGLILWLIQKAQKGQFHAKYHTPLEMVSLYWHTVELIWIFLFPCLYLIG